MVGQLLLFDLYTIYFHVDDALINTRNIFTLDKHCVPHSMHDYCTHCMHSNSHWIGGSYLMRTPDHGLRWCKYICLRISCMFIIKCKWMENFHSWSILSHCIHYEYTGHFPEIMKLFVLLMLIQILIISIYLTYHK